MNSKLILCGLTVAIAAALFSLKPDAAAGKGKPGGGGDGLTITGTIYIEDDATFDPYTLDAGGYAPQPANAFGHPSFDKHDGVRWKVKNDYLRLYFPIRRNVSVVDESSGTETLLWANDKLDVADVEWLPGDRMIGFVGRYYDSNANDDKLTAFGLYFAMVEYLNGVPIGIVGEPVQVVDYLARGETNDNDTVPAMSPDLTEVAVRNDANRSLRVYSVSTGNLLREIAVNDVAGSEHWSPDGTAIVYRGSEGITVINPDGTNRTVIAKQSFRSSMTTYTNTRWPRWSPDSRQIVYRFDESNLNKGTWEYDLHLVNRDGTQDTNVTNGNRPPNVLATGWRQ